ncbi:unnamed protein product [Prunus armeniaca]|uniref:Uncharacterized protein n=1 Tax=Prunus armeniaca TaxID=36596 RepID=A0A6J5TX25_PRUAR|nr:unnamed protein product [Prunus armeniaca]
MKNLHVNILPKQVKSFNESAEALACTGAAYLCDRSLSLGNPILIYVPKSESGSLTSADAEMQQSSDIHARSPHALHLFAEMSHSCWVCNGGTALLDFDLGCHMGIRANGGGEFLTSCFIGELMTESFARTLVRVQDYDCVHTVFTLPLGNCILDFDLGYRLGIRDQGGGLEVDNGHTGKEENFCKVYGYELESLRALLLSPRAHSKGLGAIDVLVSFPIIGEFYVGGLPIQQQGCNLRVENSLFSNSSFRPQVTSGIQKMAVVGECSAEGNWAFKRPTQSLEKLMDVMREELPNTMAAVRISGMELSVLG